MAQPRVFKPVGIDQDGKLPDRAQTALQESMSQAYGPLIGSSVSLVDGGDAIVIGVTA